MNDTAEVKYGVENRLALKARYSPERILYHVEYSGIRGIEPGTNLGLSVILERLPAGKLEDMILEVRDMPDAGISELANRDKRDLDGYFGLIGQAPIRNVARPFIMYTKTHPLYRRIRKAISREISGTIDAFSEFISDIGKATYRALEDLSVSMYPKYS